MPHIIAEYTEILSTSVDIPKMLSDLHADLAARESVDIHAIKTRAVPVQYCIVGDGHDRDKLIHITLKLLPGRDDGLRKEMAQGLQTAALKHIHKDDITVTVEVTELDAASYMK